MTHRQVASVPRRCACGWLPSAKSRGHQYRQVQEHIEIMCRDAALVGKQRTRPCATCGVDVVQPVDVRKKCKFCSPECRQERQSQMTLPPERGAR
jgi:hypothetical protein